MCCEYSDLNLKGNFITIKIIYLSSLVMADAYERACVQSHLTAARYAFKNK